MVEEPTDCPTARMEAVLETAVVREAGLAGVVQVGEVGVVMVAVAPAVVGMGAAAEEAEGRAVSLAVAAVHEAKLQVYWAAIVGLVSVVAAALVAAATAVVGTGVVATAGVVTVAVASEVVRWVAWQAAVEA